MWRKHLNYDFTTNIFLQLGYVEARRCLRDLGKKTYMVMLTMNFFMTNFVKIELASGVEDDWNN